MVMSADYVSVMAGSNISGLGPVICRRFDLLLYRLLHQEWQDGNIEHLKFQARMLSSSVPNCLANWKM